MGLDLRLTQKLTQKLVMTPQLRQAIKILQLPRGELDTLIDEELAENPVIERVTEDEAIFDDGRGHGEEPTQVATQTRIRKRTRLTGRPISAPIITIMTCWPLLQLEMKTRMVSVKMLQRIVCPARSRWPNISPGSYASAL